MVEERGFRGVSRLSSKCLDMVTTIAVAGAGALGKAIINELKSGPQYRVVVLSRKGTPKSDIPIVAIDYSNPSGIATTFEEYKITTVICAIAVIDQGSCEAQLNLIRAANSSTTVKRFIPSDFGIHFKEGHVETFPLVAFKLAAAKLLTTTRLEYTLFHCGFFLDFFGHPKISNLKDAFPLVVDVENNVAAIPGNGDVQCAFTHTNDVAKLLVKGLELEKWPEHLFMSGDKKTWKEVLALAEEVKGTKFNATFDDPLELAEGKLTVLPAHEVLFKKMPAPFATRLLSALEYWSTMGDFDFPEERSLNELFPSVQTLKVGDVLRRNYG